MDNIKAPPAPRKVYILSYVPPYDVAGTIHRALIQGGAVLLSRVVVFRAGGGGLWVSPPGAGVHGRGLHSSTSQLNLSRF